MKLVSLFGVIFFFLVYFVWAKRRKVQDMIIPEKSKKTCLDFFVPGVCIVLKKIRHIFHLRLKKDKYEQLQRMYVGFDEPELFYLYYSKMGGTIAAIFLAGLILVSASCAAGEQVELIRSYYIQRQDVAGGDKSVSLQADNGTEKRKITVKIPAREYSEEEKKQAFAEVKKEVIRALPGENVSLEKVEKPLVLLTGVTGYAINVSWELGEDGLIEEDGTVANAEIKEPVQREITAVLSYGEEEQRVLKSLTIYPQKRSASDMFWAGWEELWRQSEHDSRKEKYVMLPKNIAGKILAYRQQSAQLPVMILAGMAVLILLVPLWQQNRSNEEMNKRREQLKIDYPEFVEHFVLLIGAGLTVRGTWERIVRDYEKKQGQKIHYVYEEMALCLREMDHGMSEAKAYELFGKRTGLLSYMRFSTLIVQNLRKGSSDLLRLLDYEVANAFHQRKESAKELGEKAGTKLLLPMVVMLALVFVMILYAAFQSM